MLIIKLSGSLIGLPELARWLDVVERNGDGQVVIVPGGGFLADGVRQAQKLTHIPEEVAHRMAVLCMNQYGILMRGLNHKLVGANTELELAERGWQHRGIIWFPSQMVHHDIDLIKDKDMRADSLAAWLAGKLSAANLLIVDDFNLAETQVDAQTLVNHKLVDGHFATMIQSPEAAGVNAWLLDKQYFYLFDEYFDSGILKKHAIAVNKQAISD